ncbi:hypothetical protein GCM10010446_24100 [Streptomyces enissocaesilis]|uniref:Uncharacterized protein n=1 Tax=Streptomyces enissocaesilis TaxID=332589 RepID=A0ABN3X806_9ACTN
MSCPALLLSTFTHVVPLTGPEAVFMTVGPVVVAVFAVLGFTGLRRSRGGGEIVCIKPPMEGRDRGAASWPVCFLMT